MNRISIEEEIEQFLDYFDDQKMAAFIRDFEELYSLFNDSPVADNEDEANVTLIRAAYLISRIAEFHSGALLMVNTRFPRLWRRMYNKFIEGKTDGEASLG